MANCSLNWFNMLPVIAGFIWSQQSFSEAGSKESIFMFLEVKLISSSFSEITLWFCFWRCLWVSDEFSLSDWFEFARIFFWLWILEFWNCESVISFNELFEFSWFLLKYLSERLAFSLLLIYGTLSLEADLSYWSSLFPSGIMLNLLYLYYSYYIYYYLH